MWFINLYQYQNYCLVHLSSLQDIYSQFISLFNTFELCVWFQLSATKDIENKTTLLHYLVDTIERKFPELLNFNEELAHIDRAARVSTDTIQKYLRQMDANCRNLETDLSNCKMPQCDDDKFIEVMAVSFYYFHYPLSSPILVFFSFILPLLGWFLVWLPKLAYLLVRKPILLA